MKGSRVPIAFLSPKWLSMSYWSLLAMLHKVLQIIQKKIVRMRYMGLIAVFFCTWVFRKATNVPLGLCSFCI